MKSNWLTAHLEARWSKTCSFLGHCIQSAASAIGHWLPSHQLYHWHEHSCHALEGRFWFFPSNINKWFCSSTFETPQELCKNMRKLLSDSDLSVKSGFNSAFLHSLRDPNDCFSSPWPVLRLHLSLLSTCCMCGQILSLLINHITSRKIPPNHDVLYPMTPITLLGAQQKRPWDTDQ